MLTQLLQSLNKFFNNPVDHQQSRSIKAARGLEVTQPLPELTNADLEVLFTQLLEGVQQGRGQQWAIQYLQRMDDRISVDRWIDWLLIFAEKLLLSPAPNYQLAEQMMQLGELGIGKVGELSYDIGIRLLTGELGEPETESDTTTSKMLDHTLDSPTQELIPNFSESLWESENPEFETTAAIPAIDYPSGILTENTEYAVEAEENIAPSLVTAPEQDVMDNFREMLGESEAQKTEIPKSEPETAIGASLGRWDESANLVPQLGANL